MINKVKIVLFVLLIPFFLNANFLINDHLVSPKASDFIEKMGSELKSKTGVNGYLVTTNKKLERGISVYDFVKSYKFSEPYVAIIFIPNSQRIHLIAKPKEILSKLDKGEILDYAIKVIASEDSNSLQSKYDVGLVQAYSEMADEIADTKGVDLSSTINEGGGWILKIVNTLIVIGSIIVIWFYFIRPMILKRRGK